MELLNISTYLQQISNKKVSQRVSLAVIIVISHYDYQTTLAQYSFIQFTPNKLLPNSKAQILQSKL